jgi:hypothetical protein
LGPERLRIAHALGGLPLIDRAFSSGELSYSKVRALTRVADAKSEAPLLEQARLMTGAQLEKLVAGLRRAKIVAARRDSLPVEPQRFYRQRTADEGMVRITVQLSADEAAAVTAALDAVAARRGRRAEALVAMADERLRGDRPDRSPTEVMIHVEAGSFSTVNAEAAGMTPAASSCRPRRAAACFATPGWCRSSKTATATRSTSGERRAPCPRRYAGRWRCATAVSFPAATIRSSTRITSFTGPTAARPVATIC